MKVVAYRGAEIVVLTCEKIEFSVLQPGRIIVDDGEIVLDIADVVRIIDGRK